MMYDGSVVVMPGPTTPSLLKNLSTSRNICTNNNNNNGGNGVQKRRRVSSSALYEIWRKDLNDVCYLFVPDEEDLVKSHLMFAVREEVEVLKEKISELMERIGQLEMENSILKANATQEVLSQITQNQSKSTSNNNS